jgi:hypothetical protein
LSVIAEFSDSTCVLLYDLLLLALTLYKAVRVWRAGGRVPLLSLVVRDGVLAFLAVLSLFSANRRYVARSRVTQAVNSTVFGALAAPPNSIAWPCVGRARFSFRPR